MQMAAPMAPFPVEASVMWIDAKLTWDVKEKNQVQKAKGSKGGRMCVSLQST